MVLEFAVFLLIKILCCKRAPLVNSILISYCFHASNFSGNKSMKRQPILFKVEYGLWLKLQISCVSHFDFLALECLFSGSDSISVWFGFKSTEQLEL